MEDMIFEEKNLLGMKFQQIQHTYDILAIRLK